MIASIIFIILLIAGSVFFYLSVRKINRNISLGRPLDRNDQVGKRWLTMALVALGQSKMVTRPIAGFFHIVIYAGFIIINIEVLEIIIDGILGTHRIFAKPLGPLYDILIGSFEFLALGVLVACVIFLARRGVLRVKRLNSPELNGFPRRDATIILVSEIILMTLFLTMNGADFILQQRETVHYIAAGSFPISSFLTPVLSGISTENL